MINNVRAGKHEFAKLSWDLYGSKLKDSDVI